MTKPSRTPKKAGLSGTKAGATSQSSWGIEFAPSFLRTARAHPDRTTEIEDSLEKLKACWGNPICIMVWGSAGSREPPAFLNCRSALASGWFLNAAVKTFAFFFAVPTMRSKPGSKTSLNRSDCPNRKPTCCRQKPPYSLVGDDVVATLPTERLAALRPLPKGFEIAIVPRWRFAFRTPPDMSAREEVPNLLSQTRHHLRRRPFKRRTQRTTFCLERLERLYCGLEWPKKARPAPPRIQTKRDPAPKRGGNARLQTFIAPGVKIKGSRCPRFPQARRHRHRRHCRLRPARGR
jgi:hypothetical protein